MAPTDDGRRVLAYFSDGVDLVLDGGPTPGCEASDGSPT